MFYLLLNIAIKLCCYEKNGKKNTTPKLGNSIPSVNLMVLKQKHKKTPVEECLAYFEENSSIDYFCIFYFKILMMV